MHPLLDQYFKIIKRFTPSKPEESAVGLDISAGECKLVELRRTEDGSGFELINWAIEPVHETNVSEVISKVLKKLKFPTERIYTSIFGKGTLIRYIDMPRMTLSDMKNSLAIEADKYFPFPQDQIYTDCYILDEQAKGSQVPVLVAAAKKELIDQRLKLLTDLGLKTDFIGINPIALVNVINMLGYKGDVDERGAVALLDMGESVSNLNILINKVPHFTRDIFIGGRDLTKRISNALGVSFEEAEKLKRNPGADRDKVLGACESAVMNIVREVRLSFDYFSTERNKEVSGLLLTGGASMLNGIDSIFGNNLDVKINTWNPLDSLKIAADVPAENIKQQSLKLGVAIGLALYNYD